MDSLRLGFDTMVYHVEKGKSHPLGATDSMPNWAVRDPQRFHLAECEGKRQYSPLAQGQVTRGCIAEQQIHHTCVHHTAEPNFVDMHRSFGNENPREEELKNQDGESQNLGSNTWPRKRLRHVRHHPHVLSMFSDDGQMIEQSANVANNGYYENYEGADCEHYSEENDVTSSCICYANSNNAQVSSNGVIRVPRSGSKQALPPELETVKKCTPLYGQPDWWGEEEQTGTQQNTDDKHGSSVDRPHSLCIDPPGMEGESRPDRDYSVRYMEIPHRAVKSAEREKETPPRSISSSISKDSLFSDVSKLNTPDTPGADRIPSKEGTPDRAAQRQADPAGMAFTIDFGMDDKKDKTSKPLSEFVPSKIRKSFRERQEKAQKSQTKESTPGKSEEEQETASSSSQSKKSEESSTNEHKPLKRLSYPASKRVQDGNKRSSRDMTSPPTNKRLSREVTSPPTNKRSSREITSPPTKITDKSSSTRTDSTKGTKSIRSKKSPSATRSLTKSPKSKPSDAPALDPTLYKDPASYLIDKMFEGSGEVEDDTHPPTEHELYKESREFDVTNGKTVRGAKVPIEVLDQEEQEIPKKEGKGKEERKEEDAVSEAGTYTIDVEEETEELEESRRNINHVFGVEGQVMLERPVIDDSDSSDDQRELTLEQKRLLTERGCSMDVQAGSADNIDNLDIPDDVDLEDLSLAAMSTSDVPKWVSQWAALAKQRALKKSQSFDLPDGQLRVIESPIGRKRPGTGRKLPSIPPDQSPRGSDHSPRNGEVSPRSGELTPKQEDQIYPQDSPRSKRVTTSCQEHENEEFGGSGSDMSSGGSTKRTLSPVTSMDTEVLLQDTANVMAAMEARMADKHKSAVNGVNHSYDDSDSDSLVAVVNGDDKYVKPTVNASPRVELAKRSNSKSVVTSTPKKPPLGKALSVHRDQNVAAGRKPRSYSLDQSALSETFSESSEIGDSESYKSDVSSDTMSSKKDGKKGLITNTKPNRAFTLRRAKADAPEESPRSSRTASTTRATSRTPSSFYAPTASSTARSTSRSKSGLSGRYDSGKSEASLGAEIVKKSRENAKSSPENFDRKDGGRHSLRNYKTNSEKTLSIFNPVEAQRRNELKNLKSQLRKSEGSKSLLVQGHAARSQSQPGSRSNSPKSAERLAWKRRRNYDPRKAVADAKAKAKDTPRQKPISSSHASLALSKKKMWRSASFTTSAELSIHGDSFKNGSVSSADDLSFNTSEAADSFDEEGVRRAFIPLSGPLRDRMTHSADEDDSNLSLSSQSYDSLLISSIYQLSLKLKTASDRTLNKLREQNRVSTTPSPIEGFLSSSGNNEISAWKSANQELAGILKNLRKLEHCHQVMERVMFPEEDSPTEVSSRISSREKQKYFQEIERIRSELSGFQFIDKPESESWKNKQEPNHEDVMSPDMEEIGEEEFY